MKTRIWWIAICASAIATTGIVARAQQPGPAAVTSTLMQDMQALAERDVPFGVVLGKDDGLAMQVWRAPRPVTSGQSADAVKSNFQQDWREHFRVSQDGRVVSAISIRAGVCGPALERAVTAQAVTGTPVEVLFAVMRELDPALKSLPPPGIVWGGGTPSPTSAVFAPAKVAVERGTLRHALDAIVSSTPKLGWIATERCAGSQPCRCDLGFVTPTDTLYTSYDAAAGTASRN
jgi:hypothetical protein